LKLEKLEGEQIPFLDLKAQYPKIINEIRLKLDDILENTAFISGKYVSEFESEFAKAQQVPYCVGVSSGTDALHIALMSLGVGPGDRVVVPVNTFIATAEAVSLCGAQPLFVDCDEYFNMNTLGLTQILSEQSSGDGVIKALTPVHLYGQAADMTSIMALAKEHQISLVEDCCQAHLCSWQGTKVGNFGIFGAFSFYPGKNLGAFGEAGALVCKDENQAAFARMVRQHGEVERYHHKIIGHNYRMEAFQGAVLGTKLKYLEEWTAARRRNASLYSQLLAEVEEIETPRIRPGADHVFHLYVVQTDQREELQKFLTDKGVATGLHYPVPLHLQPAYLNLGHKEGDFPVAERAAKRILSLPMYPELTETQIHYVVDTIKSFCIRER
jgi:dTDP-4-amino-4,6-dideoxygalactose transaminase